MISEQSVKAINIVCIQLLSRREYSQRELLERLNKKGFSQSDSQVVIDSLAEKGWQSDMRFAESYARYRLKKGYGAFKISYELKQRGIDSFNLDEVVFDLDESWLNLLQQVYQKKYNNEHILLQKEWLKRSRFLQQRGFSIDLIQQLFKQLELKLCYA